VAGAGRLIAVVGPTASGKSALALRLAEGHGGEIVSCDSLQVYRGLDVGSAKASAEERRRVRHHLLDVVDPDQHFSAADYARLARAALD
jgi:tRNA dimethylallyltransferase